MTAMEPEPGLLMALAVLGLGATVGTIRTLYDAWQFTRRPRRR